MIEENALPFRKHNEKFGNLGPGTFNVQVQTVKVYNRVLQRNKTSSIYRDI